MSNFALPNFTLPKFAVPTFPGLDLSKFDLSKFDLSKFDLSKFDVSKFDLPKVELPAFDRSDVERLGEVTRDAAYAGVGLAAVIVRRVGERRRQVQSEITARVRQVVDAIA
jgi:hypothetical protein